MMKSATRRMATVAQAASLAVSGLFATGFGQELEKKVKANYLSPSVADDLVRGEGVRSAFTFYRRVDKHVQDGKLSSKSAFFILRDFDHAKGLVTAVTNRIASALRSKQISDTEAYLTLQTYRVVRNDPEFSQVIGKIYAKEGKRARLIEMGNSARQLSNTVYRKVSDTLRSKTYKTYKTAYKFNAQHRYSTAPIEVHNASTFVAAQKLVSEGYKPAVLNMANEEHPGGGFLHGAMAQEEHLCRQSNLYEGLEFAQNKGLYPLEEFEVIVTPQTTFFRDDNFNTVSPFQVDVIGSAAYICAGSSRNRPASHEDYERGMKEKMRSMMRAAFLRGNDSLLLSAFGCGAFKNDPKLISRWYKEVLQEAEFAGVFRKVVFGIIDDRNGQNFQPFLQTFAELSQN